MEDFIHVGDALRRTFPLCLLSSVCGLFLTLRHQKAEEQRKTLQEIRGSAYDIKKTGQNREALQQIKAAVFERFHLHSLNEYHKDFYTKVVFPKLEEVCKDQGRVLRKKYLKARQILKSEVTDKTEEMRKSIMYTQPHIYHVYKQTLTLNHITGLASCSK